MKPRLLPTLLLVAAAVGGLRGYGCYSEAKGARETAEQAIIRKDRDLVESNRRWLATLASVKQSVRRETLSADSAVARADTSKAKHDSIPEPAPDAPASDSVAYWKQRATLAEAEVADLRVAFAAERRASALLRLALDSARARIDSTTGRLEVQVEANERRDKWFGFIPAPSREVVFAAGVVAGLTLKSLSK